VARPDRACPDYPNECVHPWAHARTYAEVRAAQGQDMDRGAEMTDQEQPVYGSPEHAAQVGHGRHPGVRDALQWLTFAHLPGALQRFSEPFYALATQLVRNIETDSPELTTALNKIIEAKDSAVRAGIRHDTGRAGSVPRPQQVVAPPTLAGNYGPGQPRPRSAD
jgi:hypothetical protein